MAYPTGFGGGLGAALINQRKRQSNPFAGMTRGTTTPRYPFQRSGILGTVGAPQPQSGGAGGNGYAELIQNMMNQQMADIRGESVADAAGRDAAIRRFLVSYGDIPDFDSLGISGDTRGFLQGALDPRTRELAARNTQEGTSVKARIEEANRLAQRRIPAHLAARGMLRSGQTGEDLSQQAMQHKRTVFDTLNELLGGIEGTVGNFLANERARQRALADAQMQAAMAAFQNWGGYVGGGSGGAAAPSPSYIQGASTRRTAIPRFVYAGKPRRVNPFTAVK